MVQAGQSPSQAPLSRLGHLYSMSYLILTPSITGRNPVAVPILEVGLRSKEAVKPTYDPQRERHQELRPKPVSFRPRSCPLWDDAARPFSSSGNGLEEGGTFNSTSRAHFSQSVTKTWKARNSPTVRHPRGPGSQKPGAVEQWPRPLGLLSITSSSFTLSFPCFCCSSAIGSCHLKRKWLIGLFSQL